MNYEPQPNNRFTFRVNDEDVYNLTKEDVDFDSSKKDSLTVNLMLNEIEAISG